MENAISRKSLTKLILITGNVKASLFTFNSSQNEQEHHTESVPITQRTNFPSKQVKTKSLLDAKLLLE
jgi:hypothetical protein